MNVSEQENLVIEFTYTIHRLGLCNMFHTHIRDFAERIIRDRNKHD